MKTHSISRRELLKNSGALVVTFGLFGPSARALAQQVAGLPIPPGSDPYNNPDYLDPTSLDSWLAVMQDGSVTVFTGKVDLGTGVETALAQIAADELDVRFDQIHMAMGDTAKTVDQGRTAGSNTIMRAGPQLRHAAAAGRAELLKLAAARLEAPSEQLVVVEGVVSVGGSPARKVSYGELLGGKRFNLKVTAKGIQAGLDLAPEARVKNYKEYKVVGKPVPRVDLLPKLTAEFQYTPDFHLPGMLHGRVVRPATVLSKPASVDESSIHGIPGMVKVVQDGSFVGVVAETEWAAIQAARALKVTWSAPAAKMPATVGEVDAYLTNTKSFVDTVIADKGNADAAISTASRTFEATYHWPFQNHGMMGPSCAVADCRGDKVTIWTGSQGPFTTRDRVASMLGVPKRNVEVNFVEGSGCYGRLTSDDAAEDAVLMSRAVGKPVRVQWMRADEHVWEPKGPQQLMTARAAVDAQGHITAWDFIGRTFPWTEAQGTPQLGERQIGQKSTAPLPGNPVGGGAIEQIYDFDSQKVVGSYVDWPQDEPTPLRTNPLRSPGEPAGFFASESFVDEIAAALRVDAVQFRLQHLTSNPRAAEVLLAAAKQAGWKEHSSTTETAIGPKASGRGVALAIRGGTLIAAVAEVEVDRTTGSVTVKRMTIAHDCGLIINPDGLKFQIEGNVIQGTSRALMEEVKFDAAGVKSLDWNSYPVIRFKDVPEVDIVLINRPENPALGAGEPSIVPIPGAIANAIFDAVGVRLREVPFTPQRLLKALNAKGSSSA
ncbi:MAG: molybdopterin-dependent oxidoreductase [Acidobacteriia bacterium]|nr:molybdopterin-dependent oxidoreductase [Terriglobia bacterium]